VDADAFQRLLDTYTPALRRLCSVYVRNPADRQDLLQEIALALWKALPSFRGEASERTWLYRVAHNVAISNSMRARRRREVQSDEYPPTATSNEDVRHEQLLDAVRRLEPVDRELVMLYLEGLTTREIGAVLGISEVNAGVRLTRTRRRLSEMLIPSAEARK
jgi:RNA polymerase sigma factor (sigma-70 family)